MECMVRDIYLKHTSVFIGPAEAINCAAPLNVIYCLLDKAES